MPEGLVLVPILDVHIVHFERVFSKSASTKTLIHLARLKNLLVIKCM